VSLVLEGEDAEACGGAQPNASRRIKPHEELIDGAVPGLRVARTAAGLS
jgi:hypothetical protein